MFIITALEGVFLAIVGAVSYILGFFLGYEEPIPELEPTGDPAGGDRT